MLSFRTVGLVLTTALVYQTLSSAEDQIDRKGGDRERGIITSMSKLGVVLRANGVDKEIPANQILRISYDQEPGDLSSIRRDLAEKDYRRALDDLNKIDLKKVDREVVRQEIEFGRAMCMARLAMAEGGDKAAAETALKEFASRNKDSYHFYTAAELAGDLAASAGNYSDAAKYYTAVANVEWEEVRIRGSVALGRMLAAQGKHAEALEKFESVIKEAKSGDAEPVKQLAVVGKAQSLAETGKSAEAISLLADPKGVIATSDAKDTRLMARAFNALGNAYLKEGKKKDAVLAFLRTELLFFQEPDAHAEALYHLSKLFQEINKSERAAEAAAKLKQQYAGSVWASKE